VKERGAEIARLLAGSVSYVEDIRIFDELLDRLGEAYRKIRNTCRFMLGNLSNQLDPDHPRFDPDTDTVPYDQMLEIDRWALARTARLIQRCLKGYEDYQFHIAYGALYNFCSVDMSAFYLDILKDRLYTHATRSVSRRSAQTALWHILDALTRLIAPLLSFTSEEVFSAMEEGRGDRRRAESIHTLLFPRYDALLDREDLIVEWGKIQQVREGVLKALEEVRQAGGIGNSLEARVRLTAAGETAAVLRRHEADLRYIFIVSQVELTESAGADELQIEVVRAEGTKCERCWNYSAEVGRDRGFSTLCERCIPVVNDLTTVS